MPFCTTAAGLFTGWHRCCANAPGLRTRRGGLVGDFLNREHNCQDPGRCQGSAAARSLHPHRFNEVWNQEFKDRKKGSWKPGPEPGGEAQAGAVCPETRAPSGLVRSHVPPLFLSHSSDRAACSEQIEGVASWRVTHGATGARPRSWAALASPAPVPSVSACHAPSSPLPGAGSLHRGSQRLHTAVGCCFSCRCFCSPVMLSKLTSC